MNFRDAWLGEADRQGPLKKRRMKRIADNPQALKRAETAARDALQLKATAPVDWGDGSVKAKLAEILPQLIALLVKTFLGIGI